MPSNDNPSNSTGLRKEILAILQGFGVSGGRFEERTDKIMALVDTHTQAEVMAELKKIPHPEDAPDIQMHINRRVKELGE